MAKDNESFERLIEYIINDDDAKAKALFHKIVVAKSRDIYEGLVREDEPVQQDLGGDDLADDLADDESVIDGDHEGFDDEEGAGDEFAGDEGVDGGEDAGDLGGEEGEGSVEDRVMDLEDALDELKAEFDALMGEELQEPEHADLADEMGADEEGEFDADEGEGDDVGGEELGDEADVEGSKFGEASIYGESKKTETTWTDMKGKKHPATRVQGDKYDGKAAEKEEKSKKVKESRKSPADLMREYVEKVTAVKPVEGDEVGAAGTKSTVNTKSVQINGKNDMGGTTANIAQGKFASDRDSNTGPKAPNNEYTKNGGASKKMGQDKYENSPAANTKGYTTKQSAKTKEGADTAGSQSVDKKSFNPGGTSGFKG